MKNFRFSNVLRLAGFDLKNHKKLIIGWSISIFALIFMYMFLFPSVKDMAQIELEAMPEQFLGMVGMDDFKSIAEYTSYFGMVFNLIMVAISIFAATMGANLIYKEEKTKSVEFLYSLNVSRSEIYISKLLTAFCGVFVVTLGAMVSSLLCGPHAGETFIASDIVKTVFITGYTGFFFMALSLFISGVTTKINPAAAGSMLVLFCYMLGYLSTLLGDKGEWLKYLSPFEMLSPANAVAGKNTTFISLAIYAAVGLVLLAGGLFAYRKRDYNI